MVKEKLLLLQNHSLNVIYKSGKW